MWAPVIDPLGENTVLNFGILTVVFILMRGTRTISCLVREVTLSGWKRWQVKRWWGGNFGKHFRRPSADAGTLKVQQWRWDAVEKFWVLTNSAHSITLFAESFNFSSLNPNAVSMISRVPFLSASWRSSTKLLIVGFVSNNTDVSWYGWTNTHLWGVLYQIFQKCTSNVTVRCP